jgi:hypothetical protein
VFGDPEEVVKVFLFLDNSRDERLALLHPDFPDREVAAGATAGSPYRIDRYATSIEPDKLPDAAGRLTIRVDACSVETSTAARTEIGRRFTLERDPEGRWRIRLIEKDDSLIVGTKSC